MIKNVVFDLGRVLIDWDPWKHLQKFQLTQEQIDIIMHRCFETELWNEADRGIYTYRQIANILAAEFPELSPIVYRIFGEEFYSIFSELPDGIRFLVQCVKDGYSCYYLSNFGEEGFRYARRNFHFFNLFKGGIVSYEIHSVKPEPTIYETFLQKYGLLADECIFIDDSEDNVDEAEDQGFHAIQYSSTDQLEKDFQAIIRLETKRNLAIAYEAARKKLSEYGQQHLLKYYEQLTDEQKGLLLQEILDTDFSVLRLAQSWSPALRGDIQPIPAMTLSQIDAGHSQFEQTGIQAIKDNKVAAVLLAGGMGTRLGSDAPKGMYNIGITKNVYIFERIVSNLMDTVRQTGTNIHLFVMTSEKNHEATTRFFMEQNYFGYKEAYIHFFKQEMAPASDYQGNALLEQPWKLATSPNGNGGWFHSMIKHGMMDLVKKYGIEYLNVFNVGENHREQLREGLSRFEWEEE